MMRRPPKSTRTDTRFPYTTLFRSVAGSEPCKGTNRRIERGACPGSRVAAPLVSAGNFPFIGSTCAATGWIVAVPKTHEGTRHRRRLSSEERRVGNECVSKCRSRWSRYDKKRKQKKL